MCSFEAKNVLMDVVKKGAQNMSTPPAKISTANCWNEFVPPLPLPLLHKARSTTIHAYSCYL